MPPMLRMHEDGVRGGRGTLLAAVLMAGLIGGCEKNETAPEEAAETTESEDTTADERDAPEPPSEDLPGEVGATKVVLLEPGAEPRKELRYDLSVGKTQKVTMTLGMTMAMQMPGVPSEPIKTPPMKMVMDLKIAEKVGDHEARYTFELVEADALAAPGVQPMVLEMTKQQLPQMVGMKGSAIVDHRGVNRDATLELPPNLPAQIAQMMEGTKQSMNQMSSPLPVEAVGVGARWEQQQVLEQNGIKMEQKTLFELVELDGTSGVLKATIEQSAPRQTIDQQGMKITVANLDSSGTGTIRFDLAKLVPNHAEMELKTDSSFEMEQAGMSSMKMHMDTELLIEGK